MTCEYTTEDEDDPVQTDPDLDDDPTDEVPTSATSLVASHGRARAVGSGEIPLPWRGPDPDASEGDRLGAGPGPRLETSACSA